MKNLLALIVPLFYLFLLSFPNSVSADCDPLKCNCNGTLFMAKITDSCPATTPCDAGLAGPVGRQYKACYPNGPTTTDPICPSPSVWGNNSNPPPAQCCVPSGCGRAGPGGCTCTADKPTCSDSRFGFNSETGKCEQAFENAWDPKNTCDNGTKGIQSAIGCIPTGGDLTPFLAFILKWVLGAAGGIILLMLIATGYTLLTSQGNPEKLQAVKENLVSIFSGLILIGFSLVLLQTIGADILKLPTFIP